MDNNMTFLNACRNGQKGIVQIFLKKGGIDVNKRDAEGRRGQYAAALRLSERLQGHREPAA